MLLMSSTHLNSNRSHVKTNQNARKRKTLLSSTTTKEKPYQQQQQTNIQKYYLLNYNLFPLSFSFLFHSLFCLSNFLSILVIIVIKVIIINHL